jgi:tetratricopeptide (TPR) repeat protein
MRRYFEMTKDPNTELALIEAWIAKGQFERALKPLQELALANPKNARVWKDLGVVKQQQKHHQEAETHLLHSLHLDETDVDAHCSLGGVYLSLREFGKASACFERSLELSGNKSTFALLNYLVLSGREGSLDASLHRFSDALDAGEAHCREDIDAGRNLPWSCFDLAQIHLLRGEMEPCREAITQAVRLANATWQLDSATHVYLLLAESPDDEVRKEAVGALELIETLKSEYFAEPDKKRCFVIMPFGKKLDEADVEVNFDEVYEKFIKPTVEGAGLNCIRCDEVDEAGNIHKRMFQLIWNADVAIADVSIPNPNVFYELGIRHALRKAVTVIIRNKNATLPFNIVNMSAIEYDFAGGKGGDEARTRIRNAISTGIMEGRSDSHVNETLDLRISDRPRVIGCCDVYSYPIKDTNKNLAIITGDLRNVRAIDVWVNSENTNMQMARYYDFAISSVIRFEGARKTRTGHVAEDLIQHELDEIMANERSVPEAEVIATGPGELKKKYGVKAIFHAAAVRGAIGEGYEPIPGIHRCVTNALALMDDPEKNGVGTGLLSILFPLLGIGFVRGDFRPLLVREVEAALEYFAENLASHVETVYFLAWSEQELALCQSVFRSFERLGAPTQSNRKPRR